MKFLLFFAAILGVSLAQSKYFPKLRQPYYNPYSRNPYNPLGHLQPEHRPTYSRSGEQERFADTVKSNFELSPNGVYQYNYQTDNGITAEQSGYPRVLGGIPQEIAETVQGRFSWTSPEGKFISIGYVADENGYRPVGDAIPVSPPIPDYILRSIEYNKQQEALRQRKFF